MSNASELVVQSRTLKSFGAAGDGVTDDSAAWAAFVLWVNTQVAAAVLSGYPITTAIGRITPGDYLINAGAAVVNLNMVIQGEGRENCRIRIAAGQYLITASATIFNFTLKGVSTSGGKGVLKHTLAGISVQGEILIEENNFVDYTECAIGSLSADCPYWKIRKNVFYGAAALTSKGIALAADNSGSIIEGNSFLRNKYHIKMGRMGVASKILNNDFIRFSDGGGAPALTDIWLVPTNQTNDGGLFIAHNKFGNENRNAADYIVLVAEEAAGTDFLTKDHATTVSVNNATGVTMRDNDVSGAGTPINGIIYSYTPEFRGWVVDDYIRGSKYPYVVHFDAVVTLTAERFAESNQISIGRGDTVFEGWPVTHYSNAPSLGIVHDPMVARSGFDFTRTQYPVGFDPSFLDIWTTGTSGARLLTQSNTTRTNIADSLGDDDAAEYTFSTAAGFAFGYLAAPTPNRQAWIEFEVKKAAAQSLARVLVDVRYDANVNIPFRRHVNLSTNWQRVRIPWVPRTNSAVQHIEFRIVTAADYAAGVTDRFQVGRIKIYHAAEPQHFGTRYLQAKAVYDPPSLNDGIGTTTTVACVGAALGDFAEASFSLDTQGITITAWVSAADTVSVRLQNESGGVLDIASGTLRVRVRKKDG